MTEFATQLVPRQRLDRLQNFIEELMVYDFLASYYKASFSGIIIVTCEDL